MKRQSSFRGKGVIALPCLLLKLDLCEVNVPGNFNVLLIRHFMD